MSDSIEELIKTELARFARRQAVTQIVVQAIIQAIAYGSMAFFLYRIHRTVQQAVDRLQNVPQGALESLQRGPERRNPKGRASRPAIRRHRCRRWSDAQKECGYTTRALWKPCGGRDEQEAEGDDITLLTDSRGERAGHGRLV